MPDEILSTADLDALNNMEYPKLTLAQSVVPSTVTVTIGASKVIFHEAGMQIEKDSELVANILWGDRVVYGPGHTEDEAVESFYETLSYLLSNPTLKHLLPQKNPNGAARFMAFRIRQLEERIKELGG